MTLKQRLIRALREQQPSHTPEMEMVQVLRPGNDGRLVDLHIGQLQVGDAFKFCGYWFYRNAEGFVHLSR